jgi:26S proteasome regulatory subunit N2
MPKMCFLSNGRPSLYAYPPKMEEKKDLSKEKVATAVLSITEKAKKKKEEREKKGKEEKMEVDGEKKPEVKEGETATTAPAVTKAATEKAEEKKPDEKKLEEKKPEEKKPEEKKEEEKKEEKKKEPLFEFLSNPARVLPQQLKGLTMPTEVPPAPVADVEMADADKEASTAAADIETMVSNSKRYSPLKDLSIGGIILMSDKLVRPFSSGAGICCLLVLIGT